MRAMEAEVSASLTAEVVQESTLVFLVAVAGSSSPEETLNCAVDGTEIQAQEIPDEHGTRMHRLQVPPGMFTLEYRAKVSPEGVGSGLGPAHTLSPGPGGAVARPGAPAPLAASADEIRYLRPSRYCPSDVLAPTATELFAGLTGAELLRAVREWVNQQLTYVAGSSVGTDGAAETLLAREGVCRDYAHLTVAFLRAVEIPARFVAVYAPGLSPMEFHAVAEAYVEGRWYVVDATGLAPRQNMVRIATGRDAADTAFMNVYGGTATFTGIEVLAVAGELAEDSGSELLQLA